MKLACILAIAVLAACGSGRPPEHNPLAAPPVDSARIRAADVAAWAYRRTVSADLDGDGKAERVVITADAEVGANGAPLWDHGHRWAVYVEGEGAPTLLYGAFVPNGHAEAAVLTADQAGRRKVMVHERTRDRVRVATIEYRGPGAARLDSDGYYQVGEWLPGVASLR